MPFTLIAPLRLSPVGPWLLLVGAIWLAALSDHGCAAEWPARLEVIGSRTFVATPRRGVNLKAFAYYTRAEGLELLCRYAYQSRSDTLDTAFHMRSADNGRTWSEPVEVPTQRRVSNGVVRSGDPVSLQLVRESVIETDTRRDDDHPLTTFSNFYVDEDRESHELVIYCPVIGRHHPLSKNNLQGSREWTADTTEYRLTVKR